MLKCRIFSAGERKWHWEIAGECGPIAVSRPYDSFDECAAEAAQHSHGATRPAAAPAASAAARRQHDPFVRDVCNGG